MRLIIILLLFAVSSETIAQESKRERRRRTGRKNSELVDMSGRYRLSGWHFAPGIDYTLTRFNNPEETVNVNEIDYNSTFDPGGKFGLYLEAGRYKIFKYGVLFNYLDYSLAYKAIKGTETYEAYPAADNTAVFSGEGMFKHKYLLGNINLNNIYQLKSNTFLQNSIGLNLDFRFSDKRDYDVTPFSSVQADPSRLLAQLHYKFGFGIKLNEKWFMIPTLETPILNIFEWDKFKSTDPMFSSRYRPIILTIRFAWLTKSKPGDCPPVYGPADDKAKQKAYEMER